MKQKRYWLTWGIIGLIIAVVVIIYFSTKSFCIGLYMNPDGTFGSICPTGFAMFWGNLNQLANLVLVVILAVIGGVLGLTYGKLKNKFNI